MVILPRVSVVVDFYNRFYFREKRGYPTIDSGHYSNTLQQIPLTVLSRDLMVFNPLMPSGVVCPYQLDFSIFSFSGIWCTFSFLKYLEYKNL